MKYSYISIMAARKYFSDFNIRSSSSTSEIRTNNKVQTRPRYPEGEIIINVCSNVDKQCDRKMNLQSRKDNSAIVVLDMNLLKLVGEGGNSDS